MAKHGTHARYTAGCRCSECREARLAYQRAYRARTRERHNRKNREYYQANREKRIAAVAEWRARNPEKVVTNLANRYTRVKWNGGTHTAEEFVELKRACGNRCVKCGVHETGCGGLQRDHIVPLSRGGLNDIENIQPFCPKCNMRKGNRETVDYRPQELG